MTGRDHETDINGDCLPGCTACHVARLERTVERVRLDASDGASARYFTKWGEGYKAACSDLLRELERGAP